MSRDEDDTPPTGDEARAQRRQTVMPLIWLALGIVAALAFVAFALMHEA